jgi:hypothetical protein
VYGYLDALIQPRKILARAIATLAVLDGKQTTIHTPKRPRNTLYFWQISLGTMRRPELDLRFFFNETLRPPDSLSGR